MKIGKGLKKKKNPRGITSTFLPMSHAWDAKNWRIRQCICGPEELVQGFRFVDYWDFFWGRCDLQKRNMVH